MRIRYFGDSYDIVKQSLLRWLRSFGEWSVHPMFTETVSQADVSAFESLLDAKIISTEILTVDSNRAAYLSCASSCNHLFLDPDIGLRMQPTRGVRAPGYIFAGEVLRLAERRPSSLTLVFGQRVGRGSEGLQLGGKRQELPHSGVFGFAYVSHACFLFTSQDRSLVDRARAQVITGSRLPESRLLPVSPTHD